jgi:hypothetical protein
MTAPSAGDVAAPPSLRDLLLAAQRRALHLELRDFYGGSSRYAAWLKGKSQDRSAFDAEWAGHLAPLLARGGEIRRARVVSEPVTSYIRFEHEVTPLVNIAAGERVRWLPRRQASDLALPGNDYWLIDDVVLFNLFSGDGDFLENELSCDESVVALCASAFESVWARGIDHDAYQPT